MKKKRKQRGEGCDDKEVSNIISKFDQEKSFACNELQMQFSSGITHNELLDFFDAVSFKRLLAEQEVADEIVIGGTTGESPTITFEELRQAIVCAQDFPKKRIVGVGSDNTHETIEKITTEESPTLFSFFGWLRLKEI